MVRTLAAVLAVLPLAVATAAEPPARALPVPMVMVVDPQQVLQQSKAGQTLRTEHDRYQQSFQVDLESSRKALSEIEADLMKQKPVLSQDSWQQKGRDFEQKVVELNKRFQKANLAVETSYRSAMGELTRDFGQITEEVAAEAGANLVLPLQQVVVHDPRMDMTQAVIERMDRKFPSVIFPPPVFETDRNPATGPKASSRK
jgi:outer membrane protein